MKSIDLLVIGDHFYTMIGKGVGYLNKGAMAVDKGKIIAIGPEKEIVGNYKAEKLINKKNRVYMPGLIDAHMHTDDCILRGLAQDTNNWMMYGYEPFAGALTKESGLAGTKLALIEGIQAGTTTFGDGGSNMGGVCQEIRKIGVRGTIVVKVREAISRIYEKGELYEFDKDLGKKSLESALNIYNKWHDTDDGRIKIMLGPQGPDFLSKELLLKTHEKAKELKTKVHMHTQQGSRETEQVVKRYGKRPVAWLDEIGFLDDSLIAVHLTDCNDHEAKLVAKRGASMVLCSGSIGIIDGIIPPAKIFREVGGFVALGSDQAPGNNCHNIFNEMKLTALFNKIKYENPEIMPAWEVLRMATIEGAQALGIDDKVGSLEEGKSADFISIDLTYPTMMPVYLKPMRNIIPNLVYSARGNEVDTVVVNGKIIMEDRIINTIDVNEVREEIDKYTADIGEKSRQRFNKINGTNSVFMNENKL